MKHLKRFNENKTNELSIYNVMMYMMNIVDQYTVSFVDSQGYDMDPSDIKQDTNFNFIDKKFNKITADFDIIIYNKGPKGIDYGINYETYIEICSEMLSIVDYLKGNEWILTEHKSESKFGKELLYKSISYNFKMLTENINSDKSLSEHFTKEQIIEQFSKKDIFIKKGDISFNDNGDQYGVGRNIEYQEWIEIDEMEIEHSITEHEVNTRIMYICNELGADDWEYLSTGPFSGGVKIIFLK